MARRVTLAELMTAVLAAVRAAFDGSPFKVWATAPDATALPAVWPTFDASNTAAGRNAGGVVVVRLVAALSPQVAAAELAAVCDAHDRLDTLTATQVGAQIANRSATLGPVTIGGVDKTALLYDLTIARSLPC